MFGILAIVLLAIGCNGDYGYGIKARPLSAPQPIMAPLRPTYSAPAPLSFAPTYPAPAYPVPAPYPTPVQPYSTPVLQRPAYGAPSKVYGPIHAAIQSTRNVQLITSPINRQYAQPQVIEVSHDNSPVQVLFKTSSSPVTVQQHHTGGYPSVQHSAHEDKPHRLIHTITKPIIQEVLEIIQPYRRITQEIRPVIEEINTIVHKGEKIVDPYPTKTIDYAVEKTETVETNPTETLELKNVVKNPYISNGGYKAAKA